MAEQPSALFLKEFTRLNNLKFLKLYSLFPTRERLETIAEVLGELILLESLLLVFDARIPPSLDWTPSELEFIPDPFILNLPKLRNLSSLTVIYYEDVFCAPSRGIPTSLSSFPKLRDVFVSGDCMMYESQTFADFVARGNIESLKIDNTRLFTDGLFEAVLASTILRRFEIVSSKVFLAPLIELLSSSHKSLKEVVIECTIDENEWEDYETPILNESSLINNLETFQISIRFCRDDCKLSILPYLDLFLDSLKFSTKISNVSCCVGIDIQFLKLIELVKYNQSIKTLSVYIRLESVRSELEELFEGLTSHTTLQTLHFHHQPMSAQIYQALLLKESNISQLTLRIENSDTENNILQIIWYVISGPNSIRRLNLVPSRGTWVWDGEEEEVVRVDFYEGSRFKLHLLRYQSNDVFFDVMKGLVGCLTFFVLEQYDIVGNAIFIEELNMWHLGLLRKDAKTMGAGVLEFASFFGEACLVLCSD
ncbi:hypothetical protein HK098_006322 [Nowakowskiella sp. JEL0407]|nr:hypothetical protein HK098_006322 [Nowakowskiella sp. JEL0407]